MVAASSSREGIALGITLLQTFTDGQHTALQGYIQSKLDEYEITDDINFSQWESTDRTTLQTHVAPVEEFVEMLVYICFPKPITFSESKKRGHG